MDRTELIIAIAAALFGAYLLGFLTHWVINRLTHVSDAELGQLDRMAEDLHRAEEERDAALAESHRVSHDSHTELMRLRLALEEAERRAG